MATVIVPERFTGKYDGITPPTLLPVSWISGGKNIRKVSQQGGWKARLGCTLHNTTVIESGEAVDSLHYYENPLNGDEHFIAQSNSKLLTQTAQSKLPPIADPSFGTTLGVTVGTTPGFSATVGEYWFHADGSGRPIAYGGTSPRAKGFFSYDVSELAYNDFSRLVQDGRADTEAIMVGAATDLAYVITEEIASALVFNLGATVNSNDVTLVVKAWRSGSWTEVTGISDGTDSTGTMAVDGTVSWTAGADKMRAFYGIEGYVYQLSWSGALSNSVDIISINATQAACSITNKWNGEMDWVTGARFYDASATEYQECLGKVTNESTSQYIDISSGATGDYLYFKTPEPAGILGIAIVTGYTNLAASTANIDSLGYWDGDSWNELTTNLSDTTLDGTLAASMSQTGTLMWDASSITPHRRIFQGDNIPGYWYRISWDAELSTNVRVYALLYGAFPETLPSYNGCVEFKGRLFVWGDPEFPNRLRYSAHDAPFTFCGADSGYTKPFGPKDKILCAIKFYNELIVFKEKSVWLLEGDSPATFGVLKITDKVGLASPKSAVVAEVGFPAIHREEPMTIAIWQDIDGVYTFDGRKTKKESAQVDHYFNPNYSTCIPAASITNLQAFVDRTNNEYHLCLPSKELVFNYISAEWYPPWEREIALKTGVDFRANDNRHYSYGASSTGWIMRLETDTTDKTIANADKAIEHSIKTRSIGYESAERLVRFILRRILAEFKRKDSGEVTVTVFKDNATVGEELVIPKKMSLYADNYNIIVPSVTCSIEDCKCFQVEFKLNYPDEEIECYSFYYEIGGSGINE